MKVIQVMPEFGLAGAETMCENLTYELVKLNVEVVVVSMYDYHSAITDRLEKAGVKVVYLNKKSGLDVSMIGKLKKLFQEERPDAIHTHRYVMQYAIPAAILARVKKRIHTVHNVAKKENSTVARKLNYLFYHFAHVIPVALSKEIKKTICEEYCISENNVPVIYNGIDLGKCMIKQNYELCNPPKLLHIGRFSKQKNHVGLIDSFEKIHSLFPECVLELIGDGEEKEEIAELVDKKGLSSVVIFDGVQSDVHPYLNMADIFVLPSLYEGMPMTLIEAMGTGLPIVSTNVGGIPDMLQNGVDASLVDVDSNEVAMACVELLKNKNLRVQYGKEALNKSNSFSAENMAYAYKVLYEQ